MGILITKAAISLERSHMNMKLTLVHSWCQSGGQQGIRRNVGTHRYEDVEPAYEYEDVGGNAAGGPAL